MMPPISTGDPYQDKINMEKFKVQEKAFNDQMIFYSKNFTGTEIASIFPDPVAEDVGIAPRPPTIMGYEDFLQDNTSNPMGRDEDLFGGGGIRQYLNPFLQQIQQRNQAEMQGKIDPYVQEVQQITDRTFPNFSGFGGLGGLGMNTLNDTNTKMNNEGNRQSYSNISQAMGSRSNFASSPYKMS